MNLSLAVSLTGFVDNRFRPMLSFLFVLLKCLSVVSCDFKSDKSTNIQEMNTPKSFHHPISNLKDEVHIEADKDGRHIYCG